MDENFGLSLPSSSYSSFNDSDIIDARFYWNDESKLDLERFLQFDEYAEGLRVLSTTYMHVEHLHEESEKLDVVKNMKHTILV